METPPPTSETLAPSPDPPPRRRGPGALKRKANASSSSPIFPPPKRLIKERNALNIPSLHNGPLTRASRQSPNKQPSPPVAAAVVNGGGGGVGTIEIVEEEMVVDLEEPVVDAEFDAVRSRGKGVHVVPTPAAWFSWKEIHQIEKKTLDSFFNGKVESRTPEIYMEIRNSVMKKFRANPQTQLELKDLEEISVGDSDAKQEVMEFLDHWGLINFHPFPPESSDVSVPDSGDDKIGEDDKMGSALEKLFRFETVQPSFRLVPKKVEVTVPAAVPLLPESSTVEELVRPEGPSVEYHCNSCSADCSRKRYHCQKQADFDLCTECYNDGKFGSGMAPSDFILMEPAEVPGASSGSWTDQETLLLLEALELFQENWSEIAEHVATKTKAQCMLHFFQMPIEDPFLEGGDDANENVQEQTDLGSANKESSSSDVEVKKEAESVEGGNQPVSSPIDVSKSKDDCELEGSCHDGASMAIDALKAAFKDIDCMPEREGLPSFAEAGNPVMVLAAFLAHLVEPDVLTTSFRSSLKAMSEDSPGIQLATRHCFILEDPLNDEEGPPVSESAVTDVYNEEAPNGEDLVPISNGSDKPKDCTVKDEESAITVENGKNPPIEIDKNKPIENEKSPSIDNKESPSAENEKSASVENGKSPSVEREKDPAVPLQDSLKKPSNEKEVGESISPPDANPKSTKGSDCPTLPEDQITSNAIKNGTDSASATGISSSYPIVVLQKEAALSGTNEITELEPAGEQKSSIVKQSDNLATTNVARQISDTSMAVDMKPSSEELESNHKVSIGSTPESTEIADEDGRKESASNDVKGTNSTETNDGQKHQKINKLKRAAVTVLSAAAVKARLLANQEEDQIRHLVSQVIEKQLHKVETKLALFTDMESVIMRMREQTDRARQKLMYERSQIIQARLALSAAARANPPSQPANKFPTAFGTASVNPMPTIASQAPPPMRRP